MTYINTTTKTKQVGVEDEEFTAFQKDREAIFREHGIDMNMIAEIDDRWRAVCDQMDLIRGLSETIRAKHPDFVMVATGGMASGLALRAGGFMPSGGSFRIRTEDASEHRAEAIAVVGVELLCNMGADVLLPMIVAKIDDRDLLTDTAISLATRLAELRQN